MIYLLFSVLVLIASPINGSKKTRISRKQSKHQISGWNKLAGRTLVLNARFGAWPEKTVIISLGGIAIPFKRLPKMRFFLHPLFGWYMRFIEHSPKTGQKMIKTP
jgi:hypothetical protein